MFYDKSSMSFILGNDSLNQTMQNALKSVFAYWPTIQNLWDLVTNYALHFHSESPLAAVRSSFCVKELMLVPQYSHFDCEGTKTNVLQFGRIEYQQMKQAGLAYNQPYVHTLQKVPVAPSRICWRLSRLGNNAEPYISSTFQKLVIPSNFKYNPHKFSQYISDVIANFLSEIGRVQPLYRHLALLFTMPYTCAKTGGPMRVQMYG